MSSAPDRYHHGDLRRALLAAAAELIAEAGVDALTLREVARRAGVSHAAPKHHFADKAVLVSAVVAETFAEFAAALRRVPHSGTGLERLRRLGYAYLRWAIEQPDRFRLLFRPELRGPDDAAIDRGADAAFELLLDAVRAGQEDGTVTAGDARQIALAAWSGAHGVATLVIDGPFRNRGGSLSAARRSIDRILEGFRRT